jgi:pimeloyl-ACP methyl ester carboxylesterase
VPTTEIALNSALRLTPQVLLIFWLILARPADATVLETADCIDFINENTPRVTCGFFTLPLKHPQQNAPADQRPVRLPVLIAHATHDATRHTGRAILIPGAGGPGASMGFGYRYRRGEFLQPYQSLLQAGYDVVILDQRGAGLASPRLTCFEAIAVFKDLITRKRDLTYEIKRYQQSAEQCRDRLGHHGLEWFDTRQSALDFLSVMDALPYQWWGTIATSYATTIAQTMLLIAPGVFDRVVLDSPVPLDYQKPLTRESTYQSVLKSIGLCSQTDNCHARYPDLKVAFDRIIRRADATPFSLTLNTTSDAGRQKITLIINGEILLSILANAIYSNDGIAALPAVVRAVDRGRQHALRQFADDFWWQSADDLYADGLNLTIHCKERITLERQYMQQHPAYFASLSADTRALLKAQQQLCESWGVEPIRQPAATRINVPTLVISGSLDPVISADDIGHTLDDFTSASHRTLTGAGHAVWFQSACVRDEITRYFDAEHSQGLAGCEVALPTFR